jgi:hypothetical protein
MLSDKEQIQRLENEIYLMASLIVCRLLPENMGKIIDSHSRCKSTAEAYGLPAAIADDIVSLAISRPDRRYSCPLCEQHYEVPGYTRIGLARHIKGEMGAHLCSVVQSLRNAAMISVGAKERRQKEQEQAEAAKRFQEEQQQRREAAAQKRRATLQAKRAAREMAKSEAVIAKAGVGDASDKS